MDKNSVGTQYIICECGDNFPNEALLNIHLANGHGDVEVFQCDVCPAVFTSKPLLLKHSRDHEKPTKVLPPQKPLKVYPPKVETPKKDAKKAKAPPVIKLQNLKRIDSISLIQTLKSYAGLVKLEAAPVEQETFNVEMEETNQVFVKSEVQEPEQEVVNEEIYYQCDVCNTIFYTELDFNVHYQSTHAMKVESTPEEILEDHLVSDHIDNANVKAEVEAVDTAYYYECEICHKIFASEQYFNIHYSRVHGGLLTLAEEPEPEPEPDTHLVTQEEEDEVEEEAAEETETHDYAVEVEEYKPPHKAAEQVIYYKCDLCKILYPSEKAYNTHFDKNHSGQSCQPAPTGYKFIEQDLSGESRQATPGEDVFCCEFCPKTFNIKRSLQVHRKRVHSDRLPEPAPAAVGKTPNRSKVCDVCGRAYNSNAALRYHQRRHTGEKPYPCTLCPKRFTMPMFLQIHMRTHTGEKPYECPHCPKAFTNKAALIRHDRVHTGIKPYPCPECGKFFTQSNSMKLHVSTVHLKLPAPYKSKNRRDKSEARALQLALKSLPRDDDEVLGE